MRVQQSGAVVEKAPGRGELEAKEKKVKILEHQRREVRMGLGGRHCQEQGGSRQWGRVAEMAQGDWGKAAEPQGSTAGAGISIQLVPEVLSRWEAAGGRHGWLGVGVGLLFSSPSLPAAAGGE